MNYGLIEMQSYIGSFTSGQKDFNITTIDILRDVFKEFGDFLLCIIESASAILRHGHTYYMYDPHSRNIHGLPNANGSSILLTFHSFDKLSNYLRNLAMNLKTDQFELTPFKIVVGLPDNDMEHYITYKKTVHIFYISFKDIASYHTNHITHLYNIISTFYISYHDIRYTIML